MKFQNDENECDRIALNLILLWLSLLLVLCVENADFIRLFRVFDVLESDGKDRFIPVQAIRFRMA